MKRVASFSRRGLTLVELLIAVGLASILMIAVFKLLDTSLSLWSEGEVRRDVVEMAAATSELIAHDLRSLHRGEQGDLVAEWVLLDADGDGSKERAWPRLRFVRQASPAELARLAKQRERQSESSGETDSAGAAPSSSAVNALAGPAFASGGLIEVAWVVLPSVDDPAEGVFWRGERVLSDEDQRSFFSEGYFDSNGRPPAGALNEVTGGILWCGLAFATQTSLLADEWGIGPRLEDASGSWDAWQRARPDASVHEWNEPGAGMPKVQEGTPVLPRRVRFELEFERAKERQRRTRLVDIVDATQTFLSVENGARLPAVSEAAGPTYVLVEAEWMRLIGVQGDRAEVQRGQRGTAPRPHASGALVHFGARMVTEVPIALYNDDWDL